MFDVGDGIVEGGLSQLTCLGRIVHDLIVEDGEIQGKSQSDRVGGLQLGSGDICGVVICFKGGSGGLVVLLSDGVLADVSEVVPFHFKVENLGFGVLLVVDELRVQEKDDVHAEAGQFLLDLPLVVLQQLEVGRLVAVLGLLLLLDGGESSPSLLIIYYMCVM